MIYWVKTKIYNYKRKRLEKSLDKHLQEKGYWELRHKKLKELEKKWLVV